ncbi:MAG: hypothetical protein JNK06_08270 [Candidatus Accumulibacter phosphatis]|uniref:hypothetical protein n=1 Tax=Candidatus Accumulibacter phosphatis TaxID=327160 RepID=UPI001A427B0A|nr:hypothetical protein [Candidatus Accumulibacter phosphatis]
MVVVLERELSWRQTGDMEKRKPTKPEWATARRSYELGEGFSFIAGTLGVSRQAVRQRALSEGWSRVAPGPSDPSWREAAAAVLAAPVAAVEGVLEGAIVDDVRDAVLRRQQAEVCRVRALFSRALDDLEVGKSVSGREVEVATRVLTSLHKAEVAAFGLGVEESAPAAMVIRIVRELASQDDGF